MFGPFLRSSGVESWVSPLWMLPVLPGTSASRVCGGAGEPTDGELEALGLLSGAWA